MRHQTYDFIPKHVAEKIQFKSVPKNYDYYVSDEDKIKKEQKALADEKEKLAEVKKEVEQLQAEVKKRGRPKKVDE